MIKQTLLITILSLNLFTFSAHAYQDIFTPQNFRRTIGAICVVKGAHDLIVKDKKKSAIAWSGLGFFIMFPELIIKPITEWSNKASSIRELAKKILLDLNKKQK